MKNKRTLVTAGSVVLLSLILIFAVIMPVVNRRTVSNEEKNVVTDSGAVVNKPRFMYFVTKSDLEDKATKEALRRLEKEFAQYVIFDIKNVDDDKKLLENFSMVRDNTPALIMQGSDGDITTILFKTNDYDKLKAAVEAEIIN